MTNKEPSNNDIYEKLGTIHAELKQVRSQVTLTNGRVTALESWQGAVNAVERYKNSQPISSVTSLEKFLMSKGVQNILLGVGAVVAAYAIREGL